MTRLYSNDELEAILKANPDLAIDSAYGLNKIGRETAQDAMPRTVKPSKYKNIRTEYDGTAYASGREAKRAFELDLLRKAGEIIAWWRQVRFPLQGGIVYVADFVILQNDLTVEVEDCKGFLTPAYRMKKKLFREKYHGRDIKEI